MTNLDGQREALRSLGTVSVLLTEIQVEAKNALQELELGASRGEILLEGLNESWPRLNSCGC